MAEWDDHGEEYPYSYDGPDIDMSLSVPDGLFFMSLYEVNKDGHFGADNSYRDFRLSIKDNQSGDLFGQPKFNQQSELARGRVVNFCNGVYKRFLVRGPCDLVIRVRRNYSYCGGINAVMLDLPDERPVGYFESAEQWQKDKAAAAPAIESELAQWQTDKAPRARRFIPRTSERDAAQALSNGLKTTLPWNPQWWSINNKKVAIVLSRWYTAQSKSQAPSGDESTALYFGGLYQAWEASQSAMHLMAAREIEKSLRWDRVTRDNSGIGYQTIRQYLAAGSDRNNGN